MKRKRIWTLIAVAGILAGAGLRFAWLNRWPLWPDELASLRRATTFSFREHLAEMRGYHPFFEMAVLRPWTRVTRTDGGIRIPSAFFGSVTLLLVWILAGKLDRRVAAAAVWLTALSPLHLMFSRIARPYALATLLAMAAGWALVEGAQRRRWAPAGYVASAVLLVLTNLFAGVLLVAHALVLLWLYRRRPRLLSRWIVTGAVVAALLTPWLASNAIPALRWSAETPYRAQQMGSGVKMFYVLFTFVLGETVHPLNFWIVAPALAAMACAGVSAVRVLLRRQGGLLFAIEVCAVLAFGLFLGAAAPKHMTIVLPSFVSLMCLGAYGIRVRWLRAGVLVLWVGASLASIGNYFLGREFHDADMVTPWREICSTIESAERPGEAIEVGYRSDPDTWRMFRRYYRGDLPANWLFDRTREPDGESEGPYRVWQKNLSDTLDRHASFWLLLHNGDEREKIEAWLEARGCVFDPWPIGFQFEERTMQRLREGIWDAHKYRSYLYHLYRVERQSASAESPQ